MKRPLPFLQPLLLILLVLGSMVPAMAHPEAYHATGNHAAAMGFLHPFTGLDHLLVMVAVGLWSVQLGGRSLWMLPVTFVSTMLLGGMLGLSHHHASIIEHGIVASLLLLGVALGMAWRPPDFIAALGVGAAGICHGFAHGGEIPAGSAPLYFLSGMILATALLHLGGLVFGTTFRRHGLDRAIRLAGFGLVLFAAAAFFNLAS
jgi:urease accessory protein